MYGWSINVGVGSVSSNARKQAPAGPFGVSGSTRVAAASGWRSASTLKPGDLVWTFDRGLQPLADLRLRARWQHADGDPRAYIVPEGALANGRDIVLPAHQGLLLECEKASDAMGDPFAVIPVEALDGVVGISVYAPEPDEVLITPVFAGEEVIYIDSGLLLHCPDPECTRGVTAPRYDVLSVEKARALMTDLDLAELALREPEDVIVEAVCQQNTA